MSQLWSITLIKRSLTTTPLQAIFQAFVHCRLDYCDALLAGVAVVHMKRLQSEQNAAARLVSGSRRCDPITSVLARLHWSPVRQRNHLQVGGMGVESLARCSSGVFVGLLCVFFKRLNHFKLAAMCLHIRFLRYVLF